MSYQVIARKYRPQRFSDVVGQDHVSQTLANAISTDRIAHAYLFCGPRGTGKTTLARIFAKCLNCTDGPKVDFPDDDPKAQEIAGGRSMDVLEIDGASNRGIDEIRELRDTVMYAPASSKFKIYIIDEVHMLTKEAFNALLKTLEEPPEHVKFMFATTEPEKVLPTIMSRCQRYDLRRIPVNLIAEHLKYICGNENVNAAEEALYAIARGAEGCMRDAESALDQLISFCGDNINEGDVLSMFGLTAQEQLFALADAILAGDSTKVLTELNALAGQGKELGRLVGDLLEHMRNRLVYTVSKGDLGMLEISEAEANALKNGTGQASEQALSRVLDVLTDCEGRLRLATSKKILLEVSLLKAAQAKAAMSIDEVLGQLQKLRDSDTPTASPPHQCNPPKRQHPPPSRLPRLRSPSLHPLRLLLQPRQEDRFRQTICRRCGNSFWLGRAKPARSRRLTFSVPSRFRLRMECSWLGLVASIWRWSTISGTTKCWPSRSRHWAMRACSFVLWTTRRRRTARRSRCWNRSAICRSQSRLRRWRPPRRPRRKGNRNRSRSTRMILKTIR